MPAEEPTRRPTDAAHLRDRTVAPPAELLNLPWIDIHNHAHTLSWTDRERYALSGCRAMVTVASGNHWAPYKPVRGEDLRYLWDDAINRRPAIERNHFFEMHLALGVQTGVRVEDPDELLEAMEAYCDLDEVVAIGETGVRPVQHVSAWPLDEQRSVVRKQMEMARRYDLPLILHTPSALPGLESESRHGMGGAGFELNTSLAQPPVLEGDEANLEAVKLDVAAAADAGLAEERVIASHADAGNAGYLMRETECYVSFTIGNAWMTDVTPEVVAATIEEYGPERVMVDTDAANVLRSDPLAIKRAILELYRRGIDESAIRQVVLENPRHVFGIGT